VPDHCREVIQDGLGFLSRHQYSELGRALGIPTAKAQEIAIFISENLNPFPARAHWGNSLQPQDSGINVFTLPDILIYTLDGSPNSTLVVEVISPLVGRLRINPLFRKALSQAPDGKLEQWQNDIEQATLLIKCIQQRNHTIVRLAQKLVSMQREFILHGAAHLKPVTRASMAKMLDVHESTISRAVSSKAVQLPNGKIIPMARFFDRSLHIRTALCQIIAEERKPLTDTQLVRKLKQEGYSIARRTVAKYRAMEGILPAHLRASIKPTRDEQALPA
jgi:RNA polymerase sigma-54 factor